MKQNVDGNMVAVHDMFNWITVLILLPLEAASGYLYHVTKPMVSGLSNVQDTGNPQFLKVITDPLTELIVEVQSTHLDLTVFTTDATKFRISQVQRFCQPLKGLLNFQTFVIIYLLAHHYMTLNSTAFI